MINELATTQVEVPPWEDTAVSVEAEAKWHEEATTLVNQTSMADTAQEVEAKAEVVVEVVAMEVVVAEAVFQATALEKPEPVITVE